MKRRTILFAGIAGLTAAASGTAVAAATSRRARVRRYIGPKITQVTVHKKTRRMYLSSNGKVIRDYKIGLGFAPVGHKRMRGDGRTPEGAYRIDRRNEFSRYHLSLGISYPNRRDRAAAAAIGKHPGGDIFIHGGPVSRKEKRGGKDWTAGCIAVKNREMEEIYAMVENGTTVYITG